MCNRSSCAQGSFQQAQAIIGYLMGPDLNENGGAAERVLSEYSTNKREKERLQLYSVA